MSGKAPKTYIMSSLYEKGHRVPAGSLRQTAHSNVTVLLATTPEDDDRGNIKNPICLDRLDGIAARLGGVDLLVLDAGEYSVDGNVNHDFWYKLNKEGVNL